MKDRFIKECRAVGGEVIPIASRSSLMADLRRTLDSEKIRTPAVSSRCDRGLIEALGWTPGPVESADAGITMVDAAVAETGTLILSDPEELRLSLIPPIHIAIVTESQLVARMEDAWGKFDVPPKMFTLITGPSRTADIEKMLVLGAHGPKKLYVCLIGSP